MRRAIFSAIILFFGWGAFGAGFSRAQSSVSLPSLPSPLFLTWEQLERLTRIQQETEIQLDALKKSVEEYRTESERLRAETESLRQSWRKSERKIILWKVTAGIFAGTVLILAVKNKT